MRLRAGCRVYLETLWECVLGVAGFDMMEEWCCAVVGQEALQRDFEEARGTFSEEF